jgi:mRNA interferase HicA
LKREGRSHSLWTNPTTGAIEAVPRHTEISDVLARKICRGLSVPELPVAADRGSLRSLRRLNRAFGHC